MALKEHPDNVEALTLAGKISLTSTLRGFDRLFRAIAESEAEQHQSPKYYGVAAQIGRSVSRRSQHTFIKALECSRGAIGTIPISLI